MYLIIYSDNSTERTYKTCERCLRNEHIIQVIVMLINMLMVNILINF